MLWGQEQGIARLEQRLLQKIELYLKKVLPQDAFSANVTVFAEPVLAQPPAQRSSGTEILPGLEPFDNSFFSQGEFGSTPPASSEGTQTEDGVLYRGNFLIKEVSVDLTVDETISDVTVSAIQNSIINQLDTAYPGIVNVSIITADFSRVRQATQERLLRNQQSFAPQQQQQAQPAAEAQPPIIISNITEQVTPEPQPAAEPTAAEPQPPVIISNIIPEPAATENEAAATPADEGLLSAFTRESSLIWYGLLIFFGVLFFALVLFGILVVVLRQNPSRSENPSVVFRDLAKKKKKGEDDSPTTDEELEKALTPPPPPPPPLPPNRSPLIQDIDNSEMMAVESEERAAEAERRRKALQKKKNRELPDIVEELDFIKLFLKSPLASRDYFLHLSDEEKNNLILAFRSNSARRRFNSLDEDFRVNTSILEQFEDEEELETFRKDTLKRNIRNLRDYDALVALEITDPISRLSLLSEKEIESVFLRLTSEELVGISSYVDGKILVTYLKNAPQATKAELLKKLNGPLDMTGAELELIKKNIAYYVDELASRIFTPKAEREILNETILKNADDSKEIIEALKEEEPALYKRYRKYSLTFEDFLEDATEAGKRTIEKLDNDLISTAFLNVPMSTQQRILSKLNDTRKQIILSAMGSKRGVLGEDAIRAERDKLLDTYRAFADF